MDQPEMSFIYLSDLTQDCVVLRPGPGLSWLHWIARLVRDHWWVSPPEGTTVNAHDESHDGFHESYALLEFIECQADKWNGMEMDMKCKYDFVASVGVSPKWWCFLVQAADHRYQVFVNEICARDLSRVRTHLNLKANSIANLGHQPRHLETS